MGVTRVEIRRYVPNSRRHQLALLPFLDYKAAGLPQVVGHRVPRLLVYMYLTLAILPVSKRYT